MPTAATGKRRKITLYFREALLEEGAQRRRAFSALPVEATGRAAARGKLVNEDEGSERARVKRARDIKATDSFLLRITVLFAALVGAIVFHGCAQPELARCPRHVLVRRQPHRGRGLAHRAPAGPYG